MFAYYLLYLTILCTQANSIILEDPPSPIIESSATSYYWSVSSTESGPAPTPMLIENLDTASTNFITSEIPTSTRTKPKVPNSQPSKKSKWVEYSKPKNIWHNSRNKPTEEKPKEKPEENPEEKPTEEKKDNTDLDIYQELKLLLEKLDLEKLNVLLEPALSKSSSTIDFAQSQLQHSSTIPESETSTPTSSYVQEVSSQLTTLPPTPPQLHRYHKPAPVSEPYSLTESSVYSHSASAEPKEAQSTEFPRPQKPVPYVFNWYKSSRPSSRRRKAQITAVPNMASSSRNISPIMGMLMLFAAMAWR